MYISYFELRKIVSKLEKEYVEQSKNTSPQNDKKFGTYAAQAMRELDKEVKSFLQKKYE